MMKAALAFTFLLALTYSVSADNINCYSCIEGDGLPSIPGGLPGGLPDIPTIKCLEGIENSTTVTVDNTKFSCVKVDLELTIGEKTTTTTTMRGVVQKDSCPNIEDAVNKALDAVEGTEGDISCNECDEDLCNLASTAQVSFLMLLAPALAYLMRS